MKRYLSSHNLQPHTSIADKKQLTLLEALLRTRLAIQEVQQLSIAPGHHSSAGLTNSPRLLLIRDGRVRYSAGGTSQLLQPGTLVHIPSHISRSWSAVAGQPTLLSWCIYRPDAEPMFTSELIIRNDVELEVESAAMDRLAHLITLPHHAAQLQAEGELKAILARLFGESMQGSAAHSHARNRSDASIAAAAEILRQAFHQPDILDELPARVGLSQRYLRERFRQRFDMIPSQYLLQLRMRAARFHLRQQGLAVNAVAPLIGYRDPFYFSRLYKRFWGVPPIDDIGR